MSSPLQLSTARFARAAAFLRTSEPLHAALFAFHFENTSPEVVTTTLAPFQNTDGGFGGLEPDIALPVSSVLSTSIALHHLADAGLSAHAPLVERAMTYLHATFDSAHKVWPIIPAHDNTTPHAPWWQSSPASADQWSGYVDNPRPDVLACLYRFASDKNASLRARVTTLVIERIAAAGDSVEMHGLLCYARLRRAPGLPPALLTALDQSLPVWIDHAIERDPAKWHSYGLRPLDVTPTADCIGATQFADAIDANLDFLIANQNADGSWHPHWSWGEFFPDAWPAAKRRWQAILTLANLRTLRSYGRLAV